MATAYERTRRIVDRNAAEHGAGSRIGAAPESVDFEHDVIAGLSSRPKRLASKYFYDADGSALFERICDQPEYYLTRVELAIMREHVAEMADALGAQLRLVEFGSGAGSKTRLLLAALERPAVYMPVEISPSALQLSLTTLGQELPTVDVEPLCRDFTAPFALPRTPHARRTAVYFPGSTLGNFDSADALRLLQQMRRMIGSDGAVLIGLDLKKDPAVLEAAYNDAAGVTAAFTLNLLARINRELGGDFDLARFRHRARYNTLAGRIETQIVSRVEQSVVVAGRRFMFAADEPIQVEISCKYSLDDVRRLAARAGLVLQRQWLDDECRFGVFLLDAV